MTAPAITLDQAKAHLRVEHTDDDTDIQAKLDQAGAIVVDYIKKADDWAPTPSQANVYVAATLLVLSELYDDRNAGVEETERVAFGYLTPRITAILHRLRDPAMA